MVTQVLGLGEPEPDTCTVPLQTGDWLVLCSDGLNDELTDAEISEELIAAQGDVNSVAERLIQRALNHGGRDNVSVIAVEYDGPSAPIAAMQAEPSDQESEAAGSWLSALGEVVRSPLALGIGAAIVVFIVFVLLTKGG